MKTSFVPKFYPKTLSDKTYNSILLSITLIYDHCKFDELGYRDTKLNSPLEWQNKIYKNFDFETFVPFYIKQQFLEKHQDYSQTRNNFIKSYIEKIMYKLKERYFGTVSKYEKQKFKQACLNNFMNVDVKDYYMFLKYFVQYNEKGNDGETDYADYVFKVWREFDVEPFVEDLYTYDIQDFYDEIERIESYYIEYLV